MVGDVDKGFFELAHGEAVLLSIKNQYLILKGVTQLIRSWVCFLEITSFSVTNPSH
jgi:hypothetical protein